MKRRIAFGVAGLLLAVGAWQAGGGVWIHAKAALAQLLIKKAWANAQSGNGSDRPWPWADTSPVARLSVPALGVDQIVLSGASGRTLAFGPGHMAGTVAPGMSGLSVINGHRDTHFRFLRYLEPAHEILLTDAAGQAHAYRISDVQIVNSEDTSLAIDSASARLALVTCYPFDAINPGGPLRYVVFADAVDPAPGHVSAAAERPLARK